MYRGLRTGWCPLGDAKESCGPCSGSQPQTQYWVGKKRAEKSDFLLAFFPRKCLGKFSLLRLSLLSLLLMLKIIKTMLRITIIVMRLIMTNTNQKSLLVKSFPSILQILLHLIFRTTLWSHLSYYTDEKTEAQRTKTKHKKTCLQSYSS